MQYCSVLPRRALGSNGLDYLLRLAWDQLIENNVAYCTFHITPGARPQEGQYVVN